MHKSLLISLFCLAACVACPVPVAAQGQDVGVLDTGDESEEQVFRKDSEAVLPDGDTLEDDGAATVAATPLAQIIRADWKSWTGGGTANWASLVRKMQDPSIRGEHAAALAAVIRSLRKNKDAEVSSEDAIADMNEKLLKGYQKSVSALASANRSLFATGQPRFEKMQQGPATDCYFFSGNGWIAKYRPELILKAIREEPGKGYRVRFPDGQETIVSSPTDTELAYNDSASTLSDGIWMSVLAKAEGVVEARRSEKRAEISDPVLRVDIGGGPRAIVQRWTGSAPDNFQLGERANAGKVRKALAKMQEKKRMAEVFARKPKGKIAGNHCYAVLGFDAPTDMVTVWNPWGNDFAPKGPDGPDFGYTRKRGVFNISLGEFIRCFSFLSIEA